MQYFLDHFADEAATQVQQILETSTKPVVQFRNPKVGSDVAIPCFAFSKEKGQNPQAIASQVAEAFSHQAIDRAEAIGGFVNLWFKSVALVQLFVDDLLHVQDEQLTYGEFAEGKGKTAIVEFPSLNVAKPTGVGHLRAANQGWAVAQLMRAMHYTVVTDDHLGDWGSPFGKWAEGFTQFSSDARLEKDGINELARVYIKMTAELKFEAEHGKHELADKVQEWLLKLEAGDPEAVELRDRFNRLSMAHIHAIKQRLHISTDEELGESFYVPEGKKMVQELLQKGIAQQTPEGAVIVPLDEYGIETPVLIQKSNGAALYATTDMAMVKYRWERWHPAKILHLVGAEQQFHFQQIFALADKLGYGQPEFQHIWWGMIDQVNEDGTRAKMSSRKGTVLLEELLDKAEAKARSMVSEDPEHAVTDEDIQKIALGAIKFTDFAADRRTGIVFDWQHIFSLQGFSGPYVQYAGVRINAILKKFGRVKDIPFDGTYDWAAEKELLLHLHTYPQVVHEAAAQYEPHKVAQFAYDLARILNRYYEETSIARSEANLQHKRLWLLGHVQRVHAHALDLLGIEVPAKM
ncbi:MAG TPA: arginine--tRNA ligase [Candidatus Saccharimonadales bacterium]|nr:arginine--tRNA ligase [Candidatus Saccharimonadales bacterium]